MLTYYKVRNLILPCVCTFIETLSGLSLKKGLDLFVSWDLKFQLITHDLKWIIYLPLTSRVIESSFKIRYDVNKPHLVLNRQRNKLPQTMAKVEKSKMDFLQNSKGLDL